MKEFKLVKPKAHNEIIFKSDKDDDWFVHISHVEKKSGKKTSSSMILQKEVEDHLKYYHSQGWNLFDPEAPVEIKPKKIKMKIPGMKVPGAKTK